MRHPIRLASVILSPALLLSAMGCSPCGGEVERIAALASGETLVIDGACVIRESVTVPAGATVAGGTFELDGAHHVRLTPSPDAATPTTLRDARVTGGSSLGTRGGYAIGIVGEGHARIVGGELVIERGAGVAVFGATVLLEDVSMQGNLVPENVVSLPDPHDAALFASYAVASMDGADVTVAGGDSARFTSAGFACQDASLTARDTTLTEHLGNGIIAYGCDLTLERVEVAGTVTGAMRTVMGIAAEASTIAATDVRIHDADGYGAFMRETDATFTAPVLERVRQAGLWAEDGSDLAVAGGTFTDLRGAGIAAVGARSLSITDTAITGTATAGIPTSSGLSSSMMGDAILAVQTDTAMTIELTGVMLVGNERIGLLLDGGDGELAPTITDVTVEPAGAALGAVAQNFTALPATWDDDIVRDASTEARDVSAAVLDVSDGNPLGILMPPTLMAM